MKGKYISTTVMLAVLAGTKESFMLSIKETKADPKNHLLIWCKPAEKRINENSELNPA